MAKQQSERFYKMHSNPKGLGFVVVEFSDKACTKKTGWRSNNFSCEELKSAVINKRKEWLDFKPPPVTHLNWKSVSNQRYERLKAKGKRP